MPKLEVPARHRILIFDDNASNFADLTDIPQEGLDVSVVRGGTRERLLREIGSFDGYICSLRFRVDREVLDAAGGRLKLVATNSTGTDHLDLHLLEQRGIAVISNKNDREILNEVTSTAELAFSLLLTCARPLPECFESTRRGQWLRHAMGGRQISGKTLGIIGLGRLGTMMAEYGRAFRMRLLATDPTPEKFPEWVERTDLDRLLQESDFVSLHVHLTEQTHHLLGVRELDRMKWGSCLINTSRGGLVNEDALISQMKAGRIAAAGLDVIDGEWLEDKSQHPLIRYSRENPKLYITPHIGGATPEAGAITGRHLFRKVVQFFQSVSGR